MLLTLSVTEGDLISAQRLHATPAPWLASGLLISFLVLVAYCYAIDIISPSAAIGAVAAMFGWIVLLFFVIIPNRARRIYRRQKSLHREHAFHWDDQFLYFQSEDYEGKIRWTDFTKVKENRVVLLLYHSESLFNLFPRHCFPNREKFEEFRAHVAPIGKG